MMHWAPRVRREKIRRLYQTNAMGMVDQEMIDDVGYSLYARCLSIVEVTEAVNGRVKCPNCGETCQRAPLVKCEKCSWQIDWRDYQSTYARKKLVGGTGIEPVEYFAHKWPSARIATKKMLLIDRLIHEFHVKDGKDIRPIVANVIEGRTRELARFLDELAYEPGTSGMKTNRDTWHDRVVKTGWFPTENDGVER